MKNLKKSIKICFIFMLFSLSATCFTVSDKKSDLIEAQQKQKKLKLKKISPSELAVLIQGERQKKLNTQFLLAARLINKNKMSRLLKLGADVNAKDLGLVSGTALQAAGYWGDLKMAQFLIDKGADVNLRDKHGTTALQEISRYGRTEMAQLLIEKGADVNAKNMNGWTALHRAVWYGHIKTAQLLIDKGADLSAKQNYGRTALHWASQNGQLSAAQLLIKNGADVNAKDTNGWTALYFASQKKYLGAVQPDMVRLLIKNGADVNTKDKNGKTALDLADDKEIVKLLKSLGGIKNN